MPQVRFEPTIPVFERVKTFHASDRAATVISKSFNLSVISYQTRPDCTLLIQPIATY
jgi:hypothetical protein